MDIPKRVIRDLSQSERFCIGLRQLAEECGMSSTDRNGLGMLKFYFDDGSKIGCLQAFYDAGIISSM